MEVDGAFEFDGADELFVAAADEDLSFAREGGGLVDGALEGGGVEGGPVAGGAEFEDVEDFDSRAGGLEGEGAERAKDCNSGARSAGGEKIAAGWRASIVRLIRQDSSKGRCGSATTLL